MTVRAAQAIAFELAATALVGDPGILLGASANTGNPITYSITSGASSAHLEDGVLLLDKPGSVTVKATQVGGAINGVHYNAASASRTIVILKRPQTVAFDVIPDKVYGDPSFALTATSDIGQPVSFAITSGTAIQLSGSMATIVDSGIVTIRASAPAATVNGLAHDGASVSRTVTVNKADQTIIFTDPGPILQNKPTYLSPYFSVLPAGRPLNYTIIAGTGTLSASTITLPADATIRVSQAGNSKYNPTSIDCALSVVAPPVVLTASVLEASIGTTITFTASGGSGTGAYTWAGDVSGTGSTRTLTSSSAGTKTVTVYRAASAGSPQSETTSLTVAFVSQPAQPSVTLTLSPANVSAGVPVTLTAGGGAGSGQFHWGGDFLSGTGQTKTVTYPTVGTYTVTLYRAASQGWNQSSTRTFKIEVLGTDPAMLSLVITNNNATAYTISTPTWVSFRADPYDSYTTQPSMVWSGHPSLASSTATTASARFDTIGTHTVQAYAKAHNGINQSNVADVTVIVTGTVSCTLTVPTPIQRPASGSLAIPVGITASSSIGKLTEYTLTAVDSTGASLANIVWKGFKTVPRIVHHEHDYDMNWSSNWQNNQNAPDAWDEGYVLDPDGVEHFAYRWMTPVTWTYEPAWDETVYDTIPLSYGGVNETFAITSTMPSGSITVTLKVKDQSGMIAVDTKTITLNTPVTITPMAGEAAVGSSIAFTASGGSGTGGYVWGGAVSGSGTNKSLSRAVAGSETVTVYREPSAGVSASSTVSATAKFVSAPTQPAVTIAMTPDYLTAGVPVLVGAQLTFAAAGGAGTGVYTWGGALSGTGPTQSFVPTAPGEYTVTVYRGSSSGWDQSSTASITFTAIGIDPEPLSIWIQDNNADSITINTPRYISFVAFPYDTFTDAPQMDWSVSGPVGVSIQNSSSTRPWIYFDTVGTYTVRAFVKAGNGFNQSNTAFATVIVTPNGTTLMASLTAPTAVIRPATGPTPLSLSVAGTSNGTVKVTQYKLSIIDANGTTLYATGWKNFQETPRQQWNAGYWTGEGQGVYHSGPDPSGGDWHDMIYTSSPDNSYTTWFFRWEFPIDWNWTSGHYSTVYDTVPLAAGNADLALEVSPAGPGPITAILTVKDQSGMMVIDTKTIGLALYPSSVCTATTAGARFVLVDASGNVYGISGGTVSFTLKSASGVTVLTRTAPLSNGIAEITWDVAPDTTIGSDYTVTATYSGGGSDPAGLVYAASLSASSTSLQDTVPPAAPTNLHVTNQTSTSLTLSWSAATDVGTGVSEYEVHRNSISLGTTNNVSMNVSGWDAGASAVTLVVRARDLTGNWSDATGLTVGIVDTTAPSAPTMMSYVEKTDRTVTVIWSGAVDNVGVTGYRVFRGGVLVGTSIAPVWNDSGLNASTSYTYVVTAVDAADNESLAGSPLDVTTLADQGQDTDQDGLPDVIETALGTSGTSAATRDSTNEIQSNVHRPIP